jgi:hypothetical protein
MNSFDVKQLNLIGKKVFLDYNPSTKTYDISNISISFNTYRGFWRLTSSSPGASLLVRNYFNSQTTIIRDTLKRINTEIELDQFAHLNAEKLRDLLKPFMSTKIDIESYNKTRKLVDLFFEHFVALDEGLRFHRKILVPLLFVPLDSQILNCVDLFSSDDRKKLGIPSNMSFSRIKTKNLYNTIQTFLKEQAQLLNVENTIYFDLIWNNSHLSNASNLYDLKNQK